MRDQRIADRADLPRACIADDRAADAGKPVPIHVRRVLALTFMAPHEDDDIVRTRIGEWDSGVGGAADRGRDARDDFEIDALFAEQQRFFRAAVEYERIPPLEPDD